MQRHLELQVSTLASREKMAEDTQIPNNNQLFAVTSDNRSAGNHTSACKVNPTPGSLSRLSNISSKNSETTERDQVMLPKYGEECQNILSRSVAYPMSSVQRFPVPDEMVSWQVALHFTKNEVFH